MRLKRPKEARPKTGEVVDTHGKKKARMCVFFARGHISIRAGDMALKTPLGNEIENIAPPTIGRVWIDGT